MENVNWTEVFAFLGALLLFPSILAVMSFLSSRLEQPAEDICLHALEVVEDKLDHVIELVDADLLEMQPIAEEVRDELSQ